jgi:hypothetical protein
MTLIPALVMVGFLTNRFDVGWLAGRFEFDGRQINRQIGRQAGRLCRWLVDRYRLAGRFGADR